MSVPVWAITGFKVETFVSSSSEEKLRPDTTTGRVQETAATIMHGEVCGGPHKGYAYLTAYLQSMEDFDNTPLHERGLGAVCGGFAVNGDVDNSGDLTKSQKWGTTTISDSELVMLDCLFLSSDETKRHLMVACFDRTDVAHVSGFWRNGISTFGPVIQRDREDWGRDFKSSAGTANYAICLAKVKSTIVVGCGCDEPDDSKNTVEQELVSSQTFINHSCATLTDTFDVEVSMVNTHTFEFEEGQEADWLAGWKAKMPIMSEAKTDEATNVEVSFGAYQSSATSKTRTIERSAGISIPPMSGCLVTARYSKSILTLDALIAVEKTHTDGTVHTSHVPAKYIAVSCSKFEINLQDVHVEPIQ